jgi:hypothetical protein
MNPNLKALLDFMGNHPFLTVIILIIIGEIITETIKIIRGHREVNNSDQEDLPAESGEDIYNIKDSNIKYRIDDFYGVDNDVLKRNKTKNKGKWNWLKKIIK